MIERFAHWTACLGLGAAGAAAVLLLAPDEPATRGRSGDPGVEHASTASLAPAAPTDDELAALRDRVLELERALEGVRASQNRATAAAPPEGATVDERLLAIEAELAGARARAAAHTFDPSPSVAPAPASRHSARFTRRRPLLSTSTQPATRSTASAAAPGAALSGS